MDGSGRQQHGPPSGLTITAKKDKKTMKAVFLTDEQIETLRRLFAEVGKQRGLHPGTGGERFLLEFLPISQALDWAFPIGEASTPQMIHLRDREDSRDVFIFRNTGSPATTTPPTPHT